MASVLETEIESADYINFLKVGLALRELQKGLGPFISDTLKTIHDSILSSLGLSDCGSCTSSNILLHSDCKRKGCICLREPASRRYCPSGNCKKFYDELVQRHRFGNPQLENSDISSWFSNPWEFGKCFMLPHSSHNKTSAMQCDASALLTLIITCTTFEQVVGVNIQNSPKTPKDVFTEIRAIRNSVMHSEKFSMSEADMKSALDKIMTALQSGRLKQDTDAMHSSAEVQKLKDKAFVVTRPMEKEVLEDKFEAIEKMLSIKTTDLECDIDKLNETMEKTRARLQDLETRLTTEVRECKEQIVYWRKEGKQESHQHDRDLKKGYVTYVDIVAPDH